MFLFRHFFFLHLRNDALRPMPPFLQIQSSSFFYGTNIPNDLNGFIGVVAQLLLQFLDMYTHAFKRLEINIPSNVFH